jgi:hypothetical protein
MKSQLAKAVCASPHNLRFEFCSFENEVFSLSHLPARTNQRFPEIGLNAAREQNLYPRAQVLVPAATVLSDGLGTSPQAMSKESGGDYACIVYDDQLVASKPGGELSKMGVFEHAGSAVEQHHARCCAILKRLLGN